MLFARYKCPQCGKPWKNGTRHKCGYRLRVLACPRCMNIIRDEDSLLNKRSLYLNKSDKSNAFEIGCDCKCNYVEVNMSVEEYNRKYHIALSQSAKLGDFPAKYEKFLTWYNFFQVDKYIYDSFFKTRSLDKRNWRVVRFLAYLDPESEESKQYFLKEYGETYEELYRKTHDESEAEELKELSIQEEIARAARKEALHPTPKCPICGSSRLTKISAVTKAAKVSAFGILGAGDIGKTYKCNNCGARF